MLNGLLPKPKLSVEMVAIRGKLPDKCTQCGSDPDWKFIGEDHQQTLNGKPTRVYECPCGFREWVK